MATGGVSDVERGTDETFDFLCSVCKGKNKNTEAKKFCSDCNDYYCSSCVKFHADIPALKNHKILDTAQLHLGSSVKFLAVPTEMCKLHRHKPVDMYCKNHDIVACSACMLVEHNVCKDKIYVPDFINNNSNMPDSTDIAEQLDAIAKQLSMLQKTFTTEKKKLKHSKQNSLEQIQKFRKEINECLDQLEKNTVHELDQRYQSLRDKIESELKKIQAQTNEVKASQDGLKSARGNKAQTFVCVKTTQAIVDQVKSDLTKSQFSSAEVSFVADQKLKSLLNDIQVLGGITSTDKPLSQPFSQDSVQQVGNSQNSQKSDERQSRSSLLQVKGSKNYNVKVKSDTGTCNIIGACILNDRTIILSDHGNKKLKCVDPSSFTVRDFCDVPEYPHQVCTISNTEFAVCCSMSHLIQFVTVGRTIKKTRQIKIGYYCYGLAYADNKLFVSDTDSVYVHNVSGDKLQQFFLGNIGQSRLAVSIDSLNIYVTGINKGLIVLNKNGSSMGGFNGPELKRAFNVCLHNSGNFLVSACDSNNVLQFSPDVKLIGQVLKSNKLCQAICCDNNNTKLIVGFESDDEIEVFDIS